MKNTMLVLLFMAGANFAISQGNHRKAPDNVRQSFHNDFPDAGDARWSQNNGQWHANFNDRGPQDRGEMIAHYDRNGHYLQSRVPYARQDVPTPVYEGARRKYGRNRTLNFIRIERPGFGDFFQVRVNINGRTRTSYYDEGGRTRNYDDRH
jgi:hypothetical protein